jgi:hypothetical protein
MHADEAPLEAPDLKLADEQLKVPEELLIALDGHSPGRKNDLRLGGWRRPSLFRRLLNKLLGKID